jgi:hypothetical protein
MSQSNKKLAAGAVVASSLILSACSSNNIPTVTPAPTSTTAVAGKQEDQFGVAFARDFQTSANSEPFAVADGDLIPVTLLSEPVSIKC